MKRMMIAGWLLAAPVLAEDPLTTPILCEDCVAWNEPATPVRLSANSAYVGVAGLASVLIETRQGLILIDGGLPQSAPLIEANIRALGHRVEDVRYILVSHEHYDHVGGVSALRRDSGARVMAGPAAAAALAQGHPTDTDPQANTQPFPPVAGAEIVADGQQIQLGDVTVTAHRTPGHTPGSTSWTWRSCDDKGCLDLVYADSVTPLATVPGYRFAPVAAAYRASLATLAALPCDVLVTTHPGASGFWKKVEKGALTDPMACRALADRGQVALDKRLGDERH